MRRSDIVWKRWAMNHMLGKAQPAHRAGIKAVMHEPTDTGKSLSELWGITPRYTGKVIRRQATGVSRA